MTPDTWHAYAAAALERERFARRVAALGDQIAAELTATLALPGAYVEFGRYPIVVVPEPER